MTTSIKQHHHTKLFNCIEQGFETNSNNMKLSVNCENSGNHSLNASSYNNNENFNSKLVINGKPTGGTPKRRLSYQNMNSPPINQPSKLPLPDILSSSTGDLSPVIKRNRLLKEKPIKFTTFSHKNNIVNSSDSPFIIRGNHASDNLNNELGSDSPNLNDSFESAQANTLRLTCRQRRQRFCKHKSAPLSNLTHKFNNISSPISKLSSISNVNQPLNDISNHINQKILTNSLTNSIQNELKLTEEPLITDNSIDEFAELKNLIWGNDGQINNQNHIKEALEKNSQCENLIGDGSRTYILPSFPCQKKPELRSISPETLVDVLSGVYNSQIEETILIDSRYPYEYDGGHIVQALNIFTKERLYDEMFIKRVHKKRISNKSAIKTNLVKDASSSIELKKRPIIIIHCEFSSERGPSMLKFLRESDRTLNEHCYPNLFYPELYLLEGGYKSFYEKYKNFCEPQTYKPMLHEKHQSDYKHFRSKAKSWEVSVHHIIYIFNEHLQRNLHTQKEQNESEQSEPSPHRVIKMKANY